MNKRQIQGRGVGKSGPFPALAPSTIKKKGHGRPLIDSGKLFGQATRGGSVQVGYVQAFHTFVFKYTIKHKAIKFLQAGTRFMPKRPVIDPTGTQLAAFSDVIFNSLKRAFKRIGWFDRVGRATFSGFDRIDVEGQ